MHDQYDNPALRRIFASLVKRAGGGAAVVAAIREETGRSMSEGTLTKISKGEMRFDWELAFRLEDMVGSKPVSSWVFHRDGVDDDRSDFQRLADAALREIGEVPSAVFAAVTGGNLDCLEKEGGEAFAALEALLQHIRTAKAEGLS